MSQFQDEVGEWGNITFTEATSVSICSHLKREVIELDQAARTLRALSADLDPKQLKRELALEAADCYMLLLHLCHRNQIDLEETAKEKFEINKANQRLTMTGPDLT